MTNVIVSYVSVNMYFIFTETPFLDKIYFREEYKSKAL